VEGYETDSSMIRRFPYCDRNSESFKNEFTKKAVSRRLPAARTLGATACGDGKNHTKESSDIHTSELKGRRPSRKAAALTHSTRISDVPWHAQED